MHFVQLASFILFFSTFGLVLSTPIAVKRDDATITSLLSGLQTTVSPILGQISEFQYP